MQAVEGIGGFFFRSANPEAIKNWYERHLGINISQLPWHQQAGPTVFEPFPADSDYFGAAKGWMINFRVPNLIAMVAQLEAAGIAVETREEWDSTIGRFARIHDPDGNPIELWEPSAGEAR